MESLRRLAESIAKDQDRDRDKVGGGGNGSGDASGRAGMTPAGLEGLSPAEAQRVLHDLQVHQIELELQNEELRQAQDALEASRARYFDLYDLAPVGYFTLDQEGLILEANLTGATLLGVARGALAGQPFSRYVVADDVNPYYLHRRQLFRTGTPQAFELRLARRNGAPFAAWLEATLVPDRADAPSCRVVVSDITERKVIQESLRRSLSLLQSAGKMALVGGWAIQLPRNELHWSDEMCALLDFPNGTVPPLEEALALYPPASHKIIAAALAACASDGTPFDCELEIFSARRRRLNVRAIGQAVRDAHGKITGIEGAFQDISEQKKAEQSHASLEAQLRESQKMEAIGTLAGGIAHDFNNILQIILGNTELARMDAGANWQALVSLEEIQKAGHRARDLVQQILSFSRRQPTWRRVMSLPAVVEESTRLLRAALPAGVRIECRCAADTPSIVADPTQVEQVLLNLGTNAAYAMEGKSGTIEITVEGVTLDGSAAGPSPKLRPGSYARVVVSDSGRGMDAATRRRIFEPFFTTKPAGKGTGLGLSVAHGIMRTHDGAIDVHSEPGKGSRFELYFPHVQDGAADSGMPGTVGLASAGRGQHILYLDDDEAQVFLIKRMLERWGYRVSAYLEQREALDALLGSDQHFDLMVTDFNMPGISGLDVARTIRDARPGLPVVMVSGYITDELRAQALAAGVRELIAKPHEVEELRDVVQRLVGRRETDASHQDGRAGAPA
ncbi:MAG: response regulator [Betaproteobacteria bacterium]|nr:response regulator [Betaproteobacteria bacterium]